MGPFHENLGVGCQKDLEEHLFMKEHYSALYSNFNFSLGGFYTGILEHDLWPSYLWNIYLETKITSCDTAVLSKTYGSCCKKSARITPSCRHVAYNLAGI